MMATLGPILAAVAVPLIKMIFEMIAGKKLSSKEFAEYIVAHSEKKARAGQVALDWDAALKKARAKLADKSK